MTETTVLNIDTKGAQKSIADLEKELQETNEQLKQVDVNSKAFSDLQKQVANVKGQLDQINKTTDTLSKGFQGFGANLAKITGGISGGITAATAAMQLFSVENENVVAGIAKLQQLMAFTQGISSLKDLGEGFKNLKGAVKAVTGSFNGLKGAIIGTGIGALVVALGLLIENWDKVTAAIDDFIGTAGEASRVSAVLDASLTAIKTTVIAVGKAIVSYITTPFKSIYNAIQAYSEESGSFFDKIKAGAKAIGTTVTQEAQSTVSNFKKIGTETAKAYNDSIDAQNAEAKAKRDAERQKELEVQKALNAKKAEEAYKSAETLLQIEEERLKRQNLAEEDSLRDQLEIENRRLELIKSKFGEQSLEYEKQLTTISELRNHLAELSTSETTEESTTLEDPEVTKWKQRAEAYKESLISEQQALQEQLAELSILYEQGRLDYETYQTNLTDISQQQNELRAQQEQATLNNSIAVMQAGSAFLTDLLSDIADSQDQTNKEGFEKSKKLQIAAATINMLTGITAAIAGLYTTKSGPWDIALAAIQAAAIAASGAVNIAKIKKQQYNSSSSSTPSVSSTVSSAALTTPQQYTQAVQGANIEESLADQRVYVVESDIQQTGHRVSVQESENTY